MGLGVTEGGIEVFADIDWNEQRAAATGTGVMGILPCYEDILKELERSLSARLRCSISSRQLQGLTPGLLHVRENDPDDLPD